MSVNYIFDFLLVFGVSIFGSAIVVSFYAFGIKFLATPAIKPNESDKLDARDDEEDDIELTGRPKYATLLAYICFAISAICVLYGIYLIVPALGGS